jgi:membrane protein
MAEPRTLHGPTRWAEVGLRAVKAYGQDRGGLLAAGVTYYTLISLFPLLLAALSVAGFFLTDPADQANLIDKLIDNLPIAAGEGRKDLADVISSVVSARGTLGVVGILGALWTGSALFTAIRSALDDIFRVKHERPFILGKILDIASVFGFGVLLALSAAATILIAYIQKSSDDLFGDTAARPVAIALALGYFTVPAIFSAVVFFLLYTVIPRHGAPPRYAIPGAVFSAICFEGLKIGFTWYVASFGNYNATYGSLGFVIVLLAFVSFASQIMLIGAELVWSNLELIKGNPASETTVYQVDAVRAQIAKLLHRTPPAVAAPPVATPRSQGIETHELHREAAPTRSEPAAGQSSRGGLVAAWLLLIGLLATGIFRWRQSSDA